MQPERKAGHNHGPVTADELLPTAKVALGDTAGAVSAAGDAYLDEPITIDEILTALNKVPRGYGR